MTLDLLHYKRMRWAPGLLVLWLFAWSVALANPCILQIPTAGQASAAADDQAQRAHPRSRGHGHAQMATDAHGHADQAAHDHSECDHAQAHSGESVLPNQADQNQSVSLAFLLLAFVIPLPALQPVRRLASGDHNAPAPPRPIYLDTARLRI